MKIINRPHGSDTKRPCRGPDLFLVGQGLQCGNCLVLVHENIPDHLVDVESFSPTRDILAKIAQQGAKHENN